MRYIYYLIIKIATIHGAIEFKVAAQLAIEFVMMFLKDERPVFCINIIMIA